MLDEKVRHLFEGLDTAQAILAKADLLYASKDPLRYRDMLTELKNYKFIGGSMEIHIAEVRSKIAALRDYTCDPISSSQELNFLSDTLGEKFNDVKARVISGDIDSWDKAVKLIRATASLLPPPENPTPNVGPTSGVALAAVSPVPANTNRQLKLSNSARRELALKLAEQGTPVCTICFVLGHYAEGHSPSRTAGNSPAQNAQPAPNGNGGTRAAAAATLANPQSSTNSPFDTLTRTLESSLFF